MSHPNSRNVVNLLNMQFGRVRNAIQQGQVQLIPGNQVLVRRRVTSVARRNGSHEITTTVTESTEILNNGYAVQTNFNGIPGAANIPAILSSSTSSMGMGGYQANNNFNNLYQSQAAHGNNHQRNDNRNLYNQNGGYRNQYGALEANNYTGRNQYGAREACNNYTGRNLNYQNQENIANRLRNRNQGYNRQRGGRFNRGNNNSRNDCYRSRDSASSRRLHQIQDNRRQTRRRPF